MAVRRLAEPHLQPASFAFTAENLAWAERQISRYPEGRQQSAVIPLLGAPRSRPVAGCRRRLSSMSPQCSAWPRSACLKSRPFTQCSTLSPSDNSMCSFAAPRRACCAAPKSSSGSAIRRSATSIMSPPTASFPGSRSSVSAPASTPRWLRSTTTITKTSPRRASPELLDDLVAGKSVQPGPQVDRQLSAPVGGLTTLTDPELYGRSNGGGRSAPLTDASAKKPGAAANVRDAAVPQPPVGDKTGQ